MAQDFPFYFCEQNQFLVPVTTDRNNQFTAFGQLILQWFGDVGWRTGDDNGIERCLFRPALVAVPSFHMDIGIAQLFQNLLCGCPEGGDNLYAVDLSGQFGEKPIARDSNRSAWL